MLRPATPLSALLFVAFGLLLISVLSTPIIQAIPLGSINGFNFGVFGYCNGNACSKIEIGYDTCRSQLEPPIRPRPSLYQDTDPVTQLLSPKLAARATSTYQPPLDLPSLPF